MVRLIPIPLFLAIFSVLSGCNSGSSGSKDTSGGSTGVDIAGADVPVTDGSDATDGTDGGDAGDGGDVSGSDSGAPDVETPPTDADEPEPDATEEDTAEPQPGQICGTFIDGGLPLGAPCSDHSECGTGYCYDEELFNEDGQIVNRFCTAKCAGCTVVGSCNEWPKAPGVEDNKCTPLTSTFINKHKLALTSVCLVGCQSDGDCAGLGEFTKCRLLQFDGSCSYGVAKVCQPDSFAGNEECN